jgi:hypothetical protein
MPRVPDPAKREVWRRRLSEFDRGNATIAEFCRREAVAVSSFYRWRQNLEWVAAAASGRHRQRTTTQDRDARSLDRSRRVGAKPKLKFVPVEITGRSSIEVHLPNGARVTVPCHDRDAIGAVIAALLSDSQEARPC